MSARPIKTPGPDHPITIAPSREHVIVHAGGHVIADTTRALTLQESNYPPVLYIPREDVAMGLLEASEHTSYCPYKGDCSYYSITAGGAKAVNAVWSYESPYPSVAAIAGHLAFYPERVDAIERTSEA